MSTAVAKVSGKAKSFMPTKEEALEGVNISGAIVTGLIGSHALLTMVKQQNNGMVLGATAAAGVIGAMKVKPLFPKVLLASVAAYAGIKLLNKATAAVAAPGATEGIAGLLPEGVKEKLRQFIPTFAGIDEVAGLGCPGNMGDADFEGLSLDDQGNYEGVGEDDLSSDFSHEGVGNLEKVF